MSFHVPNKLRIRGGHMGSTDAIGNNGIFEISLAHSQKFMTIASDGLGWEHVSISRRDRCPTWQEMCQIKEMFWDDTDCVVQYHPAESEYVNQHPFCLHLWRQAGLQTMPMPPSILVGFKKVA